MQNQCPCQLIYLLMHPQASTNEVRRAACVRRKSVDMTKSMTDLSRRAFIARTTMLAGALPCALRAPSGRPAFARAGPALRIGVVNPPAAADDARGMGITLGAEEAQHAAALFGGSLTVVPLHGDALPSDLSAIIGDHDCATTRRIGALADPTGVPVMNVACADDALRGAECRRSMFHIVPSEAMCRAAVAQAVAEAHATPAATVTAWLPSLHRFGADTLNGRFVARFRQPMSQDSWTAWLAMKILWESALRVGSGEPPKLATFLTRDTTQFDGHKGLPLSFRQWDRQLRQPLYVVEGTTMTELPAANPNESARALLDQYGATATSSTCHISS
jgi:hypothetical protein